MGIVHEGFEAFRKGTLGCSGANLFVDAKGVVRRIAEQDLDGDGCFDIVFPNSHGFIERGPTSIFTKDGEGWLEKELPHDSCWKVRVADVDGDGYDDLVIANGENGVTSILTSYIYWGGPNGLTGERTEFATEGAYDAAILDLTGNGKMDVVFTRTWYDHHYPGDTKLQHVFVQESPRQFREATEEFPFLCTCPVTILHEDLTGNGYKDLIFVGYKDSRLGNENTVSIFYAGPEGLAKEPVTFHSGAVLNAVAADLFGTGYKDLIFACCNSVAIHPNRGGKFSTEDVIKFEVDGPEAQFFDGRCDVDAADVDGDGIMEVIVGSSAGMQIRKASNLSEIWQKVDGFHCSGVKAHDFDGKGKMDILACCYATRKTYDTASFRFHNVNDTFSFDHVTEFATHGAVNVEVADLNHDGVDEIIFCNTMSGPSQSDPEFPVFCYKGTPEGKYSADNRVIYPVNRGAYSYAAADVDNDGYLELIVTSWDSARIFKGTANGPDPNNYYEVKDPSGRITGGVLLADFNGDGWLDLILTSKNGYLFHGGPEGYSNDRREELPCYLGTAQSIAVADINGDGYLDFVHSTMDGNLKITWGTRDGLDLKSEPTFIPLKNNNGAAIIGLTAVDINHDGKVELVATTCGHYVLKKSYLNILYDPDNGYPIEKQASFETGGTTGYVSLADMRGTGSLDLIVPFYSTVETRELPMRIFFNDGNGNFDFDHPLQIPCLSSIASIPVDLNRNGYPDLLICCHRNDLGHTVESLLVSNGPDGLDLEHPQRLLGYGPHDFTHNYLFNVMDRGESEFYTSAVVALDEKPAAMFWTATEPNDTELRMRVRYAATEDALAAASWSEPVENGAALNVPADACFMQYQAEFYAPNACGSPRLTRVEIR